MGRLGEAKYILRTEGVKRFVYKLIRHIYWRSQIRSLMLRWKYGDLAPTRDEVIYVSPQNINYTLPNANHPYDLPQFGIVGGDWDEYTKDIDGDDQFVTTGLKQRYVDGRDWKNTEYYSKAIAYIKSGKNLTQLDSYEQTEQGLKKYFNDLDTVFESLAESGFNEPSQMDITDLPKVHVGRDGQIILTHGHHRVVMCKILNIDPIPARVGVRHTKWQRIRTDSNLDQIPEDHPDHPNS